MAENFFLYIFAFVKLQKSIYMKYFILLFGLLFGMSLQAIAEKREVKMTIVRKGNDQRDMIIHRSPMQLPVEINYDSETGIVEITGDDELEAQISLTDESGNTLAFSPTINTVFEVPTGYTGILLI